MPRPYRGPTLWLDPRRGTWTILDGQKRIRTGHAQHERDLAVIAINEYSKGTYSPDRPRGPTPLRATPARKGVYVLGFGPYVKIGITTNIDQRMAGLQTPEPAVLYALLDGWLSDELNLHRRFAEYRLNGEWFRKEGRLAVWIDAGCMDHAGYIGIAPNFDLYRRMGRQK